MGLRSHRALQLDTCPRSSPFPVIAGGEASKMPLAVEQLIVLVGRQRLPLMRLSKARRHASLIATIIRSRVSGRSRKRIPIASNTALAIAAAVGPATASPRPSDG
jgi:hypothetical protein